MKEDNIKIVFTRKGMQEEIERQRNHNPLVNRVLNSCAYAGMSREETYPVLAYYALLESETLKETVEDLLKNAPNTTLMGEHNDTE